MSSFIAGEWPVLYAGTGCSSFAGADEDSGLAQMQQEFEALAADLLWNWTNRLFGSIVDTVRPVVVTTPWRPSTFEGMGPESAYYELGSMSGRGYLPFLSSNGGWSNIRCGRCGGAACGCDPARAKALHLPGPILQIVEILIDGEVLPPSSYRVDGTHTLIRTDGQNWPTAQDLIEETTEPGTWSIEYHHGIGVPTGGQIAAGLLACELYKAATADATCGLPSRVKSVTRQGVSMELVNTEFNDIKDGRTGIWLIDSWIGSVTGARDYVGIASPDTTSRSRRDYSYRT